MSILHKLSGFSHVPSGAGLVRDFAALRLAALSSPACRLSS